MAWAQSQFDKCLMAFFVLALCAFSLVQNEKVSAFALQGAAGCLGCLLTLVTARRTTPPDTTATTTTLKETTIG